MATRSESPLFLSDADVARVAIAPNDATSIVERVLIDAASHGHASRRIVMTAGQPDASFQVTTGVVASDRVAGLKWISVASAAAPERARISGLVVVNDFDSGMLLGIVDAAAIVALRTAAETVIAARRLARADSARLGFVASGTQALAHLDALASAFPLRSVRAYSASGRGAERLAQAARARGLVATVADSPRAAIEEMDIVVSSVPYAVDAQPFADARWLGAGVFVAFLDFAKRWTINEPFHIVAVDDANLLAELVANGRANVPDGAMTPLGSLAAGTGAGRRSREQRTAFIQCGIAAGDLALAHVALQRARSLGIGTHF